jgi:hypothetical protein
MAKTNLEQAINSAAGKFALEIVEAVKGATLEELIALQSGTPRKKPGPKPGAKKRGRPPKKVAVKKKRVVKNYPKCAYPSCNKNRFVRGKGFCGDHYKKFTEGKIKSAEEYKKGGTKKKAAPKKKVVKKKATKKRVAAKKK